jgi:hypothetical protein
MARVSGVAAIPTAVEFSHSAYTEFKLRDHYAYTVPVLSKSQNLFCLYSVPISLNSFCLYSL